MILPRSRIDGRMRLVLYGIGDRGISGGIFVRIENLLGGILVRMDSMLNDGSCRGF